MQANDVLTLVRDPQTFFAVGATGVNAEGHREILGLGVFTTEDGAGWTAFGIKLNAHSATTMRGHTPRLVA